MTRDLVYPHERSLGTITLVLGIAIWLALVVGTFGTALLALAVGFVVYLFAHSALIAHIKGNAVELSARQFPDLDAHFAACCERLGMATRPAAFVLNGNGGLNAFATRFLGRQFVVLLSDVVDAMKDHPDGLRFYIGHELGHLRMKHLTGQLMRWPALWLPLLGAAYARARESTCDRHGRACCESPASAGGALVALAAGPERWKSVDLEAYREQARHSAGFWMSFHELTQGYPWTTKRAWRIADPSVKTPSRHRLAYLMAAFVPYGGRLGSGFSSLIAVYIVGVLAAVALPAYRDYQIRARLVGLQQASEPAREALAAYYATRKQVPPTLAAAGIEARPGHGVQYDLDPADMTLTVDGPDGELLFTPRLDDRGDVQWVCRGGAGVSPSALPPACRTVPGH